MQDRSESRISYLMRRFAEDDRRWSTVFRFIKKKTLRPLGMVGVNLVRRWNPMMASRVYRALTDYEGLIDRLIEEETNEIRAKAQGAARPVFVDCGVNEAVVLSKFHARLPGFAVIGFEIQHELVEIARAKLPEADIRNCAVATTEGELEIYLPKSFGPNFRGGSTTVAEMIGSDDLHEARRCPAVRFLDLLQGLRRDGHDFIAVKMDIEGAEYPILDDLWASHQADPTSVARLMDHLMVEFHPRVLSGPQEQDAYEARIAEMGLPLKVWI